MKVNNEIKIGVMVIITIIILFSLTVKTGNFTFAEKRYDIRAQFLNIDGVNLNSPVMFNGFEVGIVDDIVIKYGEDDTTMELVLSIDEEVKLREGAKAFVKNLGFMGEKYVGLTSGEKKGAYLTPGALIVGDEPADFGQLLSQGQDIAVELKEISQNINERLKLNKQHIDNILANVDETTDHLSSITENIDEVLEENKGSVDNILTRMESMSVNLDEMSEDLKLNPWKLLYRSREKRKKEED